ncbi:MAG: glycosyltransferase family 4 protein [Thermoplasmata archaeon]
MVAVFIPSIPLVSWLLLNIIIVLRFSRARFNLIVYAPRTWLAASMLRGLGVSRRSIMDVRSGPAHRWRFLKWLEYAELKVALAFSGSDGLTFVNESTRASLMSESGELPVTTWGSGVDLDLFKPSGKPPRASRDRAVKDGGEVVMYHGSLTEDRGVLQLIQAVEVLRKRNVRATLSLLGWGPEMARIRRRFGGLIESQVLDMKHAVSYEQVPALIEACTVGTLPHPLQAKWETQMPHKLLEYLAMGKMVVATDMEAHKGFGRGVVLLPDNSPETLAGGLERVFRMSESERKERVRDSLSRVEAFSWKNQAHDLGRFIGSVMADHSQASPEQILR